MEITLNDKVKEKLAEAVKLWAAENLIGKPALLANVMFRSLEAEMIKKIKEIQELYDAAKDAGLHNADIDDLISVIGKQHQ